jgi:hypothetical protein
MLTKRLKTNNVELIPRRGRNVRTGPGPIRTQAVSGRGKPRKIMFAKGTAKANEYVCAIERNQNGKYNVRVRVTFGPARRGAEDAQPRQATWALTVYFLASSFNAAMKKLEESLQHLQKNEARLRFWGVERTDDPKMVGDLLHEIGLRLDRRKDFPRKSAELSMPHERPVPASMLAPLRRVLADSIAPERPVERDRDRALASD